MTNKEYLKEVLKIAVRDYSGNARSAQETRRQLQEIEQRLFGERKAKILQFQGTRNEQK